VEVLGKLRCRVEREEVIPAQPWREIAGQIFGAALGLSDI